MNSVEARLAARYPSNEVAVWKLVADFQIRARLLIERHAPIKLAPLQAKLTFVVPIGEIDDDEIHDPTRIDQAMAPIRHFVQTCSPPLPSGKSRQPWKSWSPPSMHFSMSRQAKTVIGSSFGSSPMFSPFLYGEGRAIWITTAIWFHATFNPFLTAWATISTFSRLQLCVG